MSSELEAIQPDEIEEYPGNGQSRAIERRRDLLPSARIAGVAAASGVVVGVAAATVVARTVRKRKQLPGRRSRLRRRKDEPARIALSRSFLIDVHMLGK